MFRYKQNQNPGGGSSSFELQAVSCTNMQRWWTERGETLAKPGLESLDRTECDCSNIIGHLGAILPPFLSLSLLSLPHFLLPRRRM